MHWFLIGLVSALVTSSGCSRESASGNQRQIVSWYPSRRGQVPSNKCPWYEKVNKKSKIVEVMKPKQSDVLHDLEPLSRAKREDALRKILNCMEKALMRRIGEKATDAIDFTLTHPPTPEDIDPGARATPPEGVTISDLRRYLSSLLERPVESNPEVEASILPRQQRDETTPPEDSASQKTPSVNLPELFEGIDQSLQELLYRLKSNGGNDNLEETVSEESALKELIDQKEDDPLNGSPHQENEQTQVKPTLKNLLETLLKELGQENSVPLSPEDLIRGVRRADPPLSSVAKTDFANALAAALASRAAGIVGPRRDKQSQDFQTAKKVGRVTVASEPSAGDTLFENADKSKSDQFSPIVSSGRYGKKDVWLVLSPDRHGLLPLSNTSSEPISDTIADRLRKLETIVGSSGTETDFDAADSSTRGEEYFGVTTESSLYSPVTGNVGEKRVFATYNAGPQ